MRFYTISDNSHYTHSYPWISRITKGLHYSPTCPLCRCGDVVLDDGAEVELMANKGSQWPDALGCGHFPFLIFSSKVVDAWANESFRVLPLKRISIIGAIPHRLRERVPPQYFGVDGLALCGAEINAEMSGYVGVQCCPACDNVFYDVAATRERQRSCQYQFALIPESWTGLQLFTATPERYVFFCTEQVITLARDYKLTNLRFVPIEEREPESHHGIDYLHDELI